MQKYVFLGYTHEMQNCLVDAKLHGAFRTKELAEQFLNNEVNKNLLRKDYKRNYQYFTINRVPFYFA